MTNRLAETENRRDQLQFMVHLTRDDRATFLDGVLGCLATIGTHGDCFHEA